MFTQKKALINGVVKELMWDERDINCFEIIDNDWNAQAAEWLSFVPNKRVVIQAGGNCGLYPLRLSYIFDRVITLEPDPVNFCCLANNCKNSKIVKLNAAVGSSCDFVTMYSPDVQNNGMHKVSGDGSTVVYAVTIDSLGLEVVDCIMLDIESYEYWALLGATDTLLRCRPTVIAELTEKKEEAISLMQSMSYFHKGYIKANTENHIFIPKERV